MADCFKDAAARAYAEAIEISSRGSEMGTRRPLTLEDKGSVNSNYRERYGRYAYICYSATVKGDTYQQTSAGERLGKRFNEEISLVPAPINGIESKFTAKSPVNYDVKFYDIQVPVVAR